MAAKLLHSLTDDNLDLQKQIGCMTGFFHLFDRPHILPPAGVSSFNGSNLRGDSNDEHIRIASTEKQRVYTESPRASCSSLLRSLSSSSLECTRAIQLEPASLDTMSLQGSSSPQFSRQHRDLRDLVKDSMYREVHGPVGSPRLQHCHDSGGLDTKKQRMRDDLGERRQLLRSFSYNSRDGTSSSLLARDAAPRFSYDGREGNRAPLDSGFLKAFKKPESSGDHFDGRAQNLQQSAGQLARPPSVVAKLMGLETLPHSVAAIETNSSVTKSYPDKDYTLVLRPSAERDSTAAKFSSSNSPRWRKADSSMKPLSSRFPIEPAPWKRNDRKRSCRKPQPPGAKRAPDKAEAAFPSVYSEIEKRLKVLEFTQSGKDLRALKQILEAMQTKKRLKHEARTAERRKPQIEEALARRNAIVAQHSQSPIVIMKPAKDPSSKSSQRESAATSAGMKNDRTPKVTQTSPRLQQLAVSPRMQQKKLELEKRARPPTPPDSSKARRQSNSPGGRRRPKVSNIQESSEKLRETVIYDSAEELSATAFVSVEQSSPVSVLDNRIHKEGKDSNFANKLQSIENLVQKLRRLSSGHDEAGTDPDQRYISEILLASGLLLRDLSSNLMDFRFHQSGHPINPELFLVLEQTKACLIKGRLRRKLVFDTVNEILGRKLVSAGLSTLNAQKLLGELCSEVEALQVQSRNTKCSSGEDDDRWKTAVWKEVMHHESDRWTGFDDEVSGAVLDIERSIFKDLVNEIVIGESAGLIAKPAGRPRSFPM